MPKNYVFETSSGVTIKLTDLNVYIRCTKCNNLKHISEVGLRNMNKQEVRNQPQCKKCRTIL